jgi:RNA polymerase sigma-70 factor (ECF subfamily)
LRITADKARELAVRIETGDASAEAELVEAYALCIRRILLKRTGNSQLANDLCQDTFVVTLKKLRAGELKKPRSLTAFIRQIAVNISIDHYRREKRYILQDHGAISRLYFHRDHKARGIDRRAIRLVLEKALEQMAVTRDREILRRFYLADEDKTSICSDLELTATHFDRVLYRARHRMRDLIRQKKGLRAILTGSLFDS